jgi:FkbM family methyltransferase
MAKNTSVSTSAPNSDFVKIIARKVRNLCSGLLFDFNGGIFRADGCEFVVPKRINDIGWRGVFFWLGEYEAAERKLVREFIKPQDNVIELGGCLGIVSCIINRLLSDGSRHIVVEANPYLIPWIFRNRERNQAGFLVENCAVGKPPETTFFIHSSSVHDGSVQHQSGKPHRLPSRSLRELNERYGPFNTLIADVEGAEGDIFESSQPELSGFRLVIVEFHDAIIGKERIERCRQILISSGFHLVGKEGCVEAWQRF